MIFRTSHLNTKLKQDNSDFTDFDSVHKLVLCDGIGEFKDSGKYSEFVVNAYCSASKVTLEDILTMKELKNLKKTVNGGTTVITANCQSRKKVNIEYLGNGGGIHLGGDFAENEISDYVYRYHEILLPHINLEDKLVRYISHQSTEKEEHVSKISLTLNNPYGDMIILFTDGLSSLEDRVIISDQSDSQRLWRHESSDIQFILTELLSFLKTCNYDEFEVNFSTFSDSILKKIHTTFPLDDDASIGFIISDEFIDYHKSKK